MIFIYSNIIVSLSTGILGTGFCHMMGVENPEIFGVFTALSTFVVYNGQRLFKATTSSTTPWLHWVTQNRKVLVLAITLALVGSVVSLLYWLNINTINFVILSIVGLLSVFYVVRIGNRNLRDIPVLKIYIIGLTWTLVLIVLPLLNSQMTNDLWPIACAHFLYVVAVTIPFDIRDLKFDKSQQLTIPQLMGARLSKLLSLILLSGFFVIMSLVNPSLLESPWFYLATGVQGLLVLFMSEKNGDFYCAGLIDGAISLLGIAYFTL